MTATGQVVLTSAANTCTRRPECWRTYLWTQSTGYRSVGTPGNDPEANVTGLALSETGTVAGWVSVGFATGTRAYRWDSSSGFTRGAWRRER